MKKLYAFILLLCLGINTIAPMNVKPSRQKNCLRALVKSFYARLMDKTRERRFFGGRSQASPEYKNLVKRALAHHKFPYAHKVHIKNIDHNRLFGLTGGWTIYLNENKLNKCTESERIFTIEHEVAHMVLMHDVYTIRQECFSCLCRRKKDRNLYKANQEKEADVLAYQSLRDQKKMWIIKEHLNWLKNSSNERISIGYIKDYSYDKNTQIQYTQDFLSKNK